MAKTHSTDTYSKERSKQLHITLFTLEIASGVAQFWIIFFLKRYLKLLIASSFSNAQRNNYILMSLSVFALVAHQTIFGKLIKNVEKEIYHNDVELLSNAVLDKNKLSERDYKLAYAAYQENCRASINICRYFSAFALLPIQLGMTFVSIGFEASTAGAGNGLSAFKFIINEFKTGGFSKVLRDFVIQKLFELIYATLVAIKLASTAFLELISYQAEVASSEIDKCRDKYYRDSKIFAQNLGISNEIEELFNFSKKEVGSLYTTHGKLHKSRGIIAALIAISNSMVFLITEFLTLQNSPKYSILDTAVKLIMSNQLKSDSEKEDQDSKFIKEWIKQVYELYFSHNEKPGKREQINIRIPKKSNGNIITKNQDLFNDKIILLTGPSGSGKSSTLKELYQSRIISELFLGVGKLDNSVLIDNESIDALFDVLQSMPETIFEKNSKLFDKNSEEHKGYKNRILTVRKIIDIIQKSNKVNDKIKSHAMAIINSLKNPENDVEAKGMARKVTADDFYDPNFKLPNAILDKPITKLSNGMRKRLVMGLTFAQNCSLLIDESFSNLDDVNKAVSFEILSNLREDNPDITIIVAENSVQPNAEYFKVIRDKKQLARLKVDQITEEKREVNYYENDKKFKTLFSTTQQGLAMGF